MKLNKTQREELANWFLNLLAGMKIEPFILKSYRFKILNDIENGNVEDDILAPFHFWLEENKIKPKKQEQLLYDFFSENKK